MLGTAMPSNIATMVIVAFGADHVKAAGRLRLLFQALDQDSIVKGSDFHDAKSPFLRASESFLRFVRRCPVLCFRSNRMANADGALARFATGVRHSAPAF